MHACLQGVQPLSREYVSALRNCPVRARGGSYPSVFIPGEQDLSQNVFECGPEEVAPVWATEDADQHRVKPLDATKPVIIEEEEVPAPESESKGGKSCTHQVLSVNDPRSRGPFIESGHVVGVLGDLLCCPDQASGFLGVTIGREVAVFPHGQADVCENHVRGARVRVHGTPHNFFLYIWAVYTIYLP